MKRLIIIILILLPTTCEIGLVLPAYSQVLGGFDRGVRDWRNENLSNFHCEADNYLQYSPLAITYALKGLGVESSTKSWSKLMVANASSFAATIILTRVPKYCFDVQRPDGTSYNSFPSGHTATAFMSAHILHKEFGHISPWVSGGAYSDAAGEGRMRGM